MRRFNKPALALAVAAALLPTAAAVFATPPGGVNPSTNSTEPPGHAKTAGLVTLQPDANPDIQPYLTDPNNEPNLSPAALEQLLRKKIKYVFVIFNENHSFDNEYGTFPGVNGLYSDGQAPRDAAHTPGFYQTYTTVDATPVQVTVHPFLMGPDQNSSVVDSVDHSHTGLATKIDVDASTGVAAMDKFAYDEYHKYAPNSSATAANKAKGEQFANVVMSHIDCDTIPFMWDWANHFTIFDNIFATEDTPSTPNAVAMIAGQSGETQWVKHGSSGQTATTSGSFLQNSGGSAGANNGGGLSLANENSGACPKGSCPPNTLNPATSTTQGPPLVNDPQPWYGSPFDSTSTLDSNGIVSGDRQPYGPYEGYSPSNVASNLTFASVPLTMMGNTIEATLAQNTAYLLGSDFDVADIQQDIPYIQKLNSNPVDWRWYQEGYGFEDSDKAAGQTAATHWSYVSHHQGPQYFGYLANTPSQAEKLKGETDFFTDIANHDLPNGGVFYIRGGYYNQMGLSPAITKPNTSADEVTAINNAKSGDDDHPSYTDRQISEAMGARVINAVAGDPDLWSKSAIIITYDESDGFYDHVPPRILTYGPDGLPQARGVRIPMILISPYARTHAVSHAEGDHNSVIETINAIFDLPPLASLPDEAQALEDGNTLDFNKFGPPGFQQKYLGPRDINSPITDSLLSGFDPKRLMGSAPPLPASFAMVSNSVVKSLPHYGGQGCSTIGMTPVTPVGEATDYAPPAGFNNLPSTYPAAN
jgi:phospholipase C